MYRCMYVYQFKSPHMKQPPEPIHTAGCGLGLHIDQGNLRKGWDLLTWGKTWGYHGSLHLDILRYFQRTSYGRIIENIPSVCWHNKKQPL